MRALDLLILYDALQDSVERCEDLPDFDREQLVAGLAHGAKSVFDSCEEGDRPASSSIFERMRRRALAVRR